ncbi:chloride channel protein [Persicirhabdus sediminis]|uniref:Chloride channel protein n=1 Tax=Persicirhabdus sediminis TaxID=454144 RepID=A0A8J7MGB5_9BACT|nr:chloride channel protein [Persicirhabdus sediminis]MBK1792322.1 chloride channel protein [Persicirhabdus sediminis]
MTRKQAHFIADWMRSRFSDPQRFLILCVTCGLLCGLAAVAFHLSIHGLFHALWETAESLPQWQFILLMLAAPSFAGLVVGVATCYFAPNAVGSGIPQTKEAYYNYGGKILSANAGWRFILGSIYCGLGNSLGREGPTVHMCSAIASRLGRMAFRKPERVQAMIPVGMAAGIGAAFNAPLSAITFVFEELLDNFSMKALGGIVIAVVIAAAVSRTILGEEPVLSGHLAQDFQTSLWMLVAIPLGLIAGLLGHAFVSSVVSVRGKIKQSKVVVWIRPAIGGLICGMLGLVGFYLTGAMGQEQNTVFSIGYESLNLAFEAELVVGILIALLVLKFFAVICNYATGGSGGLFSPTLFLGGMLGGIVAYGLMKVHAWFPIYGMPDSKEVMGGCVLLGMGAMFAAVIRCPFTSLIIIFEITGNYSLILPLMAGNMLAWQLAKRFHEMPLYDRLLVQDGVCLRQFNAYRGEQDYAHMSVNAIMTSEPYTLYAAGTAGESRRLIKRLDYCYHGYPVLDACGDLMGIVTRHDLEDAEANAVLVELVRGQDLLTITPETSIKQAANSMIARHISQVPVVAEDNPKKLIGLLTLSDIARQQNAQNEIF